MTSLRKSIKLDNPRIRLLGVSVTNLDSDDCEDRQLYLFEEFL